VPFHETGIARNRRSAVIYGPNAAGKSNLLRALQTLQLLVVNSATLACTLLLAGSATAVEPGVPNRFTITEKSFHCMTEMTRVGHFYVDNLAGNLSEATSSWRSFHRCALN
jgi:hypothetical protein